MVTIRTNTKKNTDLQLRGHDALKGEVVVQQRVGMHQGVTVLRPSKQFILRAQPHVNAVQLWQLLKALLAELQLVVVVGCALLGGCHVLLCCVSGRHDDLLLGRQAAQLLQWCGTV